MRYNKQLFFLLIILFIIYGISFSLDINLCFSYDNSLKSEEIYEGYQLAIKKLNTVDETITVNFINTTVDSTSATNLQFLLNNNPTVLSDANFLDRLSDCKLKYIVSSFPNSKYLNPYPSPASEIQSLAYALKDYDKILFLYNNNPYAYSYLKALELLPKKIIFVKKYSLNDSSLSQMIDKNSITAVITFLTPMQLKNAIYAINSHQTYKERVNIFALSVYDYFNYIDEYKGSFNDLHFLSILNVNMENDFYHAYITKFGHKPTVSSASSYDSVLILYYHLIKGLSDIVASSQIIIRNKNIYRPLYLYKVIKGEPILTSILKY